MPSSPDYKRDYAQEKVTSDARGEKPLRAARNRARTVMVNKGMVKKGDGKDVDHKTPLSKGGAKTAPSNLRAMPAAKNRSFPRTAGGGMKAKP
jgi:hypothetical protein